MSDLGAALSGVRNLGRVIRRDAASDRLALIDLGSGGRVWSAGALDSAADDFARGLMGRGLAPGASVAILAQNSAENLIAYLGTMRAGCVAVPVNFRLSADSVTFIFEDSGARLCVADAAHAHLCPAGIPLLRIGDEGPDGFSTFVSQGRAGPSPAHDAPRLAEILYTSGSTGRPKGVELSHAGQLWALGVHAKDAPAAGERTLIVAPMYHMNALFNLTLSLLSGVEVVLMPRFESRAFLQATSAHRCTVLSGIPTMFAMMARETDLVQALDLTSVRSITIASAPLTGALAERVAMIFPNATVSNGYGTTEAGPAVFGEHPVLARPPLSLGYPLKDVEVRLAAGSADEGVLEVRTPALFDGYLNLPDLTGERLKDGWYSTGDVMRRDAAGFFYFVGRADDMFVCGGENVYPGEIEKMLERHPGVLQAAVVPAPDEIKGEIPIAFVVLAEPPPAAEELKAFALREGPAFSHPRAFVRVDELPVASTHKLDKRPLASRAREVARALNRHAVPAPDRPAAPRNAERRP